MTADEARGPGQKNFHHVPALLRLVCDAVWQINRAAFI